MQYGIYGFMYDIQEIKKTDRFKISNEEFKKDPCPGKRKYLKINNHYLLEDTYASKYELENLPIGDLWVNRSAFVTFIIPTIGRQTLTNSIQSLIDNKSKLWNAMIVFDGIPAPKFDLPMIQTLSIPKIGFKNCAGEVRNRGIKLVTTEWVAFLDDDDKITPDYMYRLQSEIDKNPKADVILFRMIQPNGLVLPPKSYFAVNHVGISFAVKTNIFQKHEIKFVPSSCEDYNLLHEMEEKGFHIHLSDYITYLVR